MNHELLPRIETALANQEIPHGSSILLAVSGGPDSIALLRLMFELRKDRSFKLGIAHYNHNLRTESDAALELELVRAAAESLGLKLYTGSAGVGEIRELAKTRSLGIEAAAREFRYAFLQKTAQQNNFELIATGHTADDQIETVFLRLVNGSGPVGLRGIPPRRENIVRPLIGCARHELINFLKVHRYRYIEDASNRDLSIPRNRLRHSILPVIEKHFSDFKKAVLSGVEQLSELVEFAQAESSVRLEWRKEPNCLRLPLSSFLAAPPALRALSLYRAFDDLVSKKSNNRLPYRFLKSIIHIPSENRNLKNGSVLLKGHGVSLRVWADHLVFEPSEVVFDGERSYLIVVNGCENEGGVALRETEYLVLQTRRLVELDLPKTSPLEKIPTSHIPMDGIDFPLIIRSRRPGDTIELTNEHKTVKKLFNEWAIPPRERWRVPIIEDRRGVISVMGSVMGKQDRITSRLTAKRSTLYLQITPRSKSR